MPLAFCAAIGGGRLVCRGTSAAGDAAPWEGGQTVRLIALFSRPSSLSFCFRWQRETTRTWKTKCGP